jgi:large subunit ribosomal protein L3
MEKAIIGKKLGMTQIFDETGIMIPVTVVEAGPMTVVRKKTTERDGYEAVVTAFLAAKEDSLNKPEAGVYKKAKLPQKKHLQEFKFADCGKYAVGEDIRCDIFANGDVVDVSGTSKGRGFAGVIKRWNQRRLKMTHGTGPVHRSLGSTGANSTPSRVIKGLHMPGHYGHESVTVQNLKIVRVDLDRNVLLIKGAVPGPNGSLVTVKQAVKK